MRTIKQLVQRKDWQELRKLMLGSWNNHPERSIQRLRKWLGDSPSEDKRRIVMNYLTGTGFRTGTIKSHPSIQKLRNELKKRK